MRPATSTLLVCLFLGIILEFDRTLGEGSGSNGDGSGSGGSIDESETVCRGPANAPKIPKRREDDMIRLIRCHVACIEKVSERRNQTLKVSLTHPIWPSVTHQTLEEDCSLYQQVQECREGCTTKMRSTLEKCSSACHNYCTSTCNGSGSCDQEGTICQRQCDKGYCKIGCGIFADVVSQTDNHFLPPEPRSAPMLEIPMGYRMAGRYFISPGNTSLGMVNPSGLNLTSFLIRVLKVKKMGKSLMAFYWMNTLESKLNLEDFACLEDVLVQYYAVNKNGYSISLSVTIETVYGDFGRISPDNPDNSLIGYNFSADNRFGYWKHVEIHISWERPSGFPFLGSYLISLAPFGSGVCGEDEQTYTVERSRTSAVLTATSPRDGPVNNCSYSVSISSVPSVGPAMQTLDNIIFVRISHPIPVPLEFRCGIVWNELNGTFQFPVSWTLPNSFLLIHAISSFELQVRLIIPGLVGVGEELPDINATLAFHGDALTYSRTVGSVVYNSNSEAYYSIQLKAVPRSPLDQILLPDPRQCYHSALPFPPKPVTDVKLDRTIIRYLSFDPSLNQLELLVGVSWAVSVSSRVSGYHVTLVELKAIDGSSTGEVFALEKIHDPHRSYHKFTAFVPPDMLQGSCFYLQIRSVSVYGSLSNWSLPQCISTASLPLPNIELDRTSNGTKPYIGGIYLFVAIGAGTAVVVLVACVCMGLILACMLRKKREHEESQPNFRKCLPSNSHLNDSTSKSTQCSSQASPRRVRRVTPPLVSSSLAEMDWELFPGQIMVETRLGQGAFGEVFKGVLLGGIGLYKSTRQHSSNHFAVQFLKDTATPSEEEAFFFHIEQAKMVAHNQQSRHLVELIGCITMKRPFAFVRELPENGDLLSYLITHRTHIFKAQTEVSRSLEAVQGGTTELAMAELGGGPGSQDSNLDGQSLIKSHNLTVKELFSFVMQITSGMEYLASLGVVHGDIACRNVFLDGQNQVKITDFNLSTQRGKRQFGSRIYVGTEFGRRPLKWLSPEAITEGKCTLLSDVWAFGVTLWEIITLGGYPYNGVCNKDVLQYLLQGNRMESPDNCSPDLYAIMGQCWGGNPLKRPNITALKEALTDISTRDNIIHLQISQESSCYKIHRIRESTRIQWDHQPVGEEKDDAMSEGEDEGETADMGVVETEVNGASAISYSTANHVDLLPNIVEVAEEDQVNVEKTTEETVSPFPYHNSSPSDEEFSINSHSSDPLEISMPAKYLEDVDQGSTHSPQTMILMESDILGGNAKDRGVSRREEEDEDGVEDEGIDILTGSSPSSAQEDSPDGSNVSLNINS